MVHLSASRRQSVVLTSLFAGLAVAVPMSNTLELRRPSVDIRRSSIDIRRSSLPGDPNCISDVCQACTGKDASSVVVENFPPLAGGNIRKCSDGSLWYGRGVNIKMDSTAASATAVPIAQRAISDGASAVKLTVEAPANPDAMFATNLLTTVDEILSAPATRQLGVTKSQVLLTVTVAGSSGPNAQSATTVSGIVESLLTSAGQHGDCLDNVWFGVSDAPAPGANAGQSASYMQDTVNAIRRVEQLVAPQCKPHIVTVPGAENAAMSASYFASNPITDPTSMAASTTNQPSTHNQIVYDVRPYGSCQAAYKDVVGSQDPLPGPLMVGGVGPIVGQMTEQDAEQVVYAAESQQIPYFADPAIPSSPWDQFVTGRLAGVYNGGAALFTCGPSLVISSEE